MESRGDNVISSQKSASIMRNFMSIRVLIVDDDPLARSRIRQLLRQETDIELLGECDSGMDTIGLIAQHNPDLIFIDIHMSAINGVELMRQLPRKRNRAIVIVTAFEEH